MLLNSCRRCVSSMPTVGQRGGARELCLTFVISRPDVPGVDDEQRADCGARTRAVRMLVASRPLYVVSPGLVVCRIMSLGLADILQFGQQPPSIADDLKLLGILLTNLAALVPDQPASYVAKMPGHHDDENCGM
jgi:hypothetical protein